LRDSHGDSVANHVRASLSNFFTWAMKEGLLGDEAANPVTNTNRTETVERDRKHIVGRDLVFGTGEGGFSGWSKAKEQLDQRLLEARQKAFGQKAQPMSKWRLHDIRRSVDTHMNDELGIEPHIVEAILNHISGHKSGKEGVAGVYNKAKYRKQKTAAMARWADHLLAVIESKAAA
jgi:hypothetical protein